MICYFWALFHNVVVANCILYLSNHVVVGLWWFRTGVVVGGDCVQQLQLQFISICDSIISLVACHYFGVVIHCIGLCRLRQPWYNQHRVVDRIYMIVIAFWCILEYFYGCTTPWCICIRCFWSVGVTKLGGVSFVRMLCISGWESLPNNLGWLATTRLYSRDLLQPLRLGCLQLSWRLGEATPTYVMLLFLAALTNQRLAPNIKARCAIDFES